MRRKADWLFYISGTIAFVVIFCLFLEDRYYHYDDAFITYTFARNLASGYGIVFHPSFDPLQGSSSFLQTILLALIGKATSLPIDRIGLVLSLVCFCLLNVVTSETLKFLYPAVSSNIRRLFYLFSYLFQLPVLLSLGMETAFATLLLFLALFLIILGSRGILLGILLASIPLIRLEYLFFFPLLILVLYANRERSKDVIKIFVPSIVSTVIYLFFARIYFGEFLPHSWVAKWYFNPSISGTISLESYFINGYYTVWWLLCALSAIALFVSRSSDERRFGPRQQFGSLLIFSAIYVQILHVFGAPDMPWYIFTFFYSSELLVFFLIFHFWEHKKNLISISLCIVAFAASSLACYNFIDTRLVQRFQASGKIEFSRLGNNDRRERIGLWLNKNFQDISSKKILLYEAGKVPYYSGAKCYDLLGLVTKESFQNLRNGDMLQTLLDIKPDLVVGDKNPEYYPMSFLKSPYFGNHYRMIFEIDGYCVWSRI